MQDRYVGDVGDYGKYKLLKTLSCGEGTGQVQLSLGVIWYLVPNESHNEDGSHLGYLKMSPKNLARFRSGDPVLYDLLAEIVGEGQRKVSIIKKVNILPPNTAFYEQPLTYDGLPGIGARAKEQRLMHRKKWLNGALECTKDCDIVFVDPDNGLQVSSYESHVKKGPKYTYYEELRPFLKRNQSIVIYQHSGRNGSAEEQITERLNQLSINLGITSEIFALLFRCGTSRAFFVIPSHEHKDVLAKRAGDLCKSVPWTEHFQLFTSENS